MTQQLVLVGNGPAHVRLLAYLAKTPGNPPFDDVKVTLVSRQQRCFDASLVPGFVAGHHSIDDCATDLELLVQKSRSQWLELEATALDAAASAVLLADGQEIRYDWLSIDLEPVQQRELVDLAMPGAQANGLFVRPSEAFCKLWPRVPELAASRALRVAVICDSSAALPAQPQPASLAQALVSIELSLAIADALPNCAVTLVTGGTALAAGASPSLRARLAQILKSKNITVLPDSAVAIAPGELLLASGARLACDVPLVATRPNAPAIAAESGLALDTCGFIAVQASLRSASHPNVLTAPNFQVDDVVQFQAVRAAMAGLPFNCAPPKADHLRFIACGDGRAVASWGGFSAHGRWVHWLKPWMERVRA